MFFLSEETQGLLSERELRLELSSSSEEDKLAGFYPPPGVLPLRGHVLVLSTVFSLDRKLRLVSQPSLGTRGEL